MWLSLGSWWFGLPSVSGNVLVGGVVVGSVGGSYVDDSRDGGSESSRYVSVPVSVVVDGVGVGGGSLSYTDLVTFNGGGSRVLSVSGSVLVDGSVVGDVSGSLVDSFGRVVSGGGGAGGFPWWLLLLLVLLLLVVGRGRRG